MVYFTVKYLLFSHDQCITVRNVTAYSHSCYNAINRGAITGPTFRLNRVNRGGGGGGGGVITHIISRDETAYFCPWNKISLLYH